MIDLVSFILGFCFGGILALMCFCYLLGTAVEAVKRIEITAP